MPSAQNGVFADTPDRFAAAPDTAAPAPEDWVASFDDPDLMALVREALDANPTVAAALAGFESARASARSAGAARLPGLDAAFDASERDAPAGSVTTFGLRLDASWQADIWGRLTDQARAGALSAEAARADWYGARLTITANVARAWYALAEAQLQTELARRDVETRARQLEIVERRFARGVVRSSDVRTGRSSLASSRAALAARARAEAAASRNLETLLGRYPADALRTQNGLPAIGLAPDPGAPRDLLERRPDIVAAATRLEAAGFSANAARKAMYPGLSLRASIADQASNIEDVFDGRDLIRTVSASILAPVFRGGALRAERDRAAALAEQRAADLVNTSLTALREVENALDADRRLAERVDALEIAAAEAQAALDLLERQYASGVATIFELIDAQTRLISAQGQYISARRERIDNRIGLHLAIAGDFTAGGGITGAPQGRE